MVKQFFFLSLMVCSLGFAKPLPHFSQIDNVIQITDLDREKVESFFKGGYENTALELKKGTKLPLKFFYNLNYLSLNFKPNLTIKIEKDCYIRMVGKKGYVSHDLINWKKAKKLIHGSPVTKFTVNQENSLIEVNTEFVDQKSSDFEY